MRNYDETPQPCASHTAARLSSLQAWQGCEQNPENWPRLSLQHQSHAAQPLDEPPNFVPPPTVRPRLPVAATEIDTCSGSDTEPQSAADEPRSDADGDGADATQPGKKFQHCPPPVCKLDAKRKLAAADADASDFVDVSDSSDDEGQQSPAEHKRRCHAHTHATTQSNSPEY